MRFHLEPGRYRGLAIALAALCASGCNSRSNLVGKWTAAIPVNAQHPEVAAYDFISDGVMTFDLTSQSRGLTFGGAAGMDNVLPAGWTSDVSRLHEKGVYRVRDDVVEVHIEGVRLYRLEGRRLPFNLPPFTTHLRYKVEGDRLSLDALDGDPPIVLRRIAG
jgi:hypothetical protein